MMNWNTRVLSGVFLLLAFCIPKCLFGQTNAKYIWTSDQTSGRHEYAYFRLDFDLPGKPGSAKLNLFADSRYHLFVNGTFLNFGPARTFPENPEHDVHDIGLHLKPGANYIVVKVLWNGMETFQLLKNNPGFIAWGTAGPVDFSTPGNWLCIVETGYDQQASKMSFAQGAIDVFDARAGVKGWNNPDPGTLHWSTPTVVSHQDTWGPSKPRWIPLLDQKIMIPATVTGKYRLKDVDNLYSFRVKTPDSTFEEYNRSYRAFASTWIYSPRKQKVDAGLWWGEFYLNGQGPLAHQGDVPGQNSRRKVELNLKKGWNHFFVSYNIIWGCWDFYMALPKSAGLVVSPNQKMDDEVIFLTAGPFTREENSRVTKLPLPLHSPSSLPSDLSASWVEQSKSGSAGNPAMEITWIPLGEELPHEAWKVKNIKIDQGPGTAVMFDHGQNGYGRIFVNYEASEGTIVDIAWEEDNTGGKPNILKRHGLFTAARHISSGGTNYFETFKPYGHRYLQINVRNNKGPAILHEVGKIEHLYPLRKIGSFECSDPMMTAIWEIGWRTIRICAEDIYLDPFRERGLYAGDVLAQTTLSYVTSGDVLLGRKSLQEVRAMYRDVLADFPKVKADRHGIELLGDYPLISLVNLGWYFDITRDTLFVKESYPAYQTMMDSLALSRDSDGIFWHGGAFIEWTRINKQASLSAVHALIARAHEVMSDFATVLGKPDEAVKYEQLAKEIAQFTRDRFWDTEKGAFFDGYTRDGKKIESWFPASSAWPSAYGYTSPEQEVLLRDFFETELSDIGNTNRAAKTTPYGGQYILGALYRSGNAKIAEIFIRQYWSHMILEGDDTAWENFFFDPHESKSHGWSGAPTFYMSTRVLGVQLGYPDPTDLNVITIEPQAESIDWARGKVPHPAGLVEIDWRIEGDKLLLNYSAPAGVPVQVKPRGRLSTYSLIVNGKPARP